MSRYSILALLVVAVAGLLAVAGSSWRLPARIPAHVTRLSLFIPADQALNLFGMPMISISRDGRSVVYVANRRLFVYSMLDGVSRPVAGSEIASGLIGAPLFTRDSKSIVYWAGLGQARGSLRRVPTQGGASDIVTDVGYPVGMTFDGDDLVFGQSTVPMQQPGIYRVNSGGGKAELIIKAADGEVLNGGQILPGGDFVLFTAAKGDSSLNLSTAMWDRAQIVVQSLKTQERIIVLENGSDARYLPTGHMVFSRAGTLLAVPFDLKTLTTSGTPRAVIEGVGRMGNFVAQARTASTQFSVSDNGVAVYLPGPRTGEGQTGVAVVDFKGKNQPLGFVPGDYEQPRVSPNHRYLAIVSHDGSETSILIHELDAHSSPRRLTIGGHNQFPVWSPDSLRLVFQSDRDGDVGLWIQPADGSRPAEHLTKPASNTSHMPEAWVDADTMWFAALTNGEYTLQQYSWRTRSVTPMPDLKSRNPFNVNFATNGRWFVYNRIDVAGAPGENPLFMEPYPRSGARFPITTAGNQPLWSLNSDEVRYNPGPGEMVSVHVTTTPAVSFGPPVPFVKGFVQGGQTRVRNYDNAPDGRLIGVAATASDTEPGAQLAYVVLDWFEDLKQRVPAK